MNKHTKDRIRSFCHHLKASQDRHTDALVAADWLEEAGLDREAKIVRQWCRPGSQVGVSIAQVFLEALCGLNRLDASSDHWEDPDVPLKLRGQDSVAFLAAAYRHTLIPREILKNSRRGTSPLLPRRWGPPGVSS